MSFQHMKVNNIINKKSKITFIVESPHKDELAKGFPLAGQAGRNISKDLFSDHKSFGDMVKHGSLKGKVSIINVSTSPLQKSAYVEPNDYPENIKLYQRLKELIERGSESYVRHWDNELNRIKDEIYNNFLGELQKLPNNSFIIPCGKFARIFYTEAQKDKSIDKKHFTKIGINIPHPSASGKWSKAMTDKIKEKLDLL